MDSNTVGTLIFIVIVAVIVSFALGYFYACTRLHNRMIDAEIKLAEAKVNTIRQMQNIRAVGMKEEDLPKELKEMLDNIFKEEENNEKSKKD